MQLLFKTDFGQFAWWFRDYIRTRYGEELLLEDKSDGVHVLIKENSACFADIVQEKNQFLQNPFAEKYQKTSWQSGDTQTRKPAQKRGQNLQSFLDAIRYSGKFTLFITSLCIAVYLLDISGLGQVEEWFNYPQSAAQQGEIWRYISHSWVHLGLWHIVFNLTFWWLFGNAIERQKGSVSLITLYLLSAVGSGMAQNYMSGPYFFGLSGVVYAVMGYVLSADYLGSQNRFKLPQGFATMIAVGLVIGFVSPLWGMHIGNTAHITGLITGGVMGLFSIQQRHGI